MAAGAPWCPFGSVHNVQKDVIGSRAAAVLHQLLRGRPVTEGPRATAASAHAMEPASADGTTYQLTVSFHGGSAPFTLHGTKNCTSCCDESKGRTLDFGATADDGQTWVNSSSATLHGSEVTFEVHLRGPPTAVRYTGGATFPQCALYNAEGLPAVPFSLAMKQSH